MLTQSDQFTELLSCLNIVMLFSLLTRQWWPVYTTRVHGPWTQMSFWTPVNRGHRDRQALLLTTSLFCICRTGVQNDTRVHGPWI